MNILIIGNSFGQDSVRYLHGIAKCGGEKLTVCTLYYPGCSLERHFRYSLSEERAYGLETNGVITGFNVSLKEALLNRSWDYVMVHQCSMGSFDYETYQPYLNKLLAYVGTCVPKAKIILHETWEYTQELIDKRKLDLTPDIMYEKLHKAYAQAESEIKPAIFIKSGTLLHTLLQSGIKSIHRDGFHLKYGLGRYAVGLLWYATIFNKNVSDIDFCDFDEPIDEKDIEIIKRCVNEQVEL